MKSVEITRHAKKRIERGDQFGLRTTLTIPEVVALLRAPATLRVGQEHYAYSAKDDETYKIITARQGRTLVTMYDTRREPRIADMVVRARAGAPFDFAESLPVTDFSQDNASSLILGTHKWHKRIKGHVHITELYEIGSIFGFFKHTNELTEARFLHETVVDATMNAIGADLLSKTQIKKLHFYIDDEVNHRLGIFPVWISFALMGYEYEGGIHVSR